MVQAYSDQLRQSREEAERNAQPQVLPAVPEGWPQHNYFYHFPQQLRHRYAADRAQWQQQRQQRQPRFNLRLFSWVLAVTLYWMAGIQDDRNMYGLDSWDGTVSSLVMHLLTPEGWPFNDDVPHPPQKSPVASPREYSLRLLSDMSFCSGRRWDHDTVGAATGYRFQEATGDACERRFFFANSQNNTSRAREK